MNPHTGNHRPRIGRGPLAWVSFAIATLILASPLNLVWARPELGWVFPFVLWAGIIVLGALLARRGRDDDKA